MPQESRLVIPARLDEVRHVCDFVVEAAEMAGLDERAVYHCQMAVDETLTNIIEHGYHFEGEDHDIEVYCQTKDDQFLITIADDSPAFNPLEHDSPDPTAPLDDREPGGWGIYFIRRLMDDVTYERQQHRNRLTLVKRLPTTVPGARAIINAEETFPVRQLEDRRAVISPAGRLDSNTSPRLETVLNVQLRQGITCLFVDMTAVEYIASS